MEYGVREMRELTGTYSKVQCHDTDDYILTDIWKGEIPPHVGLLWKNYFDIHKRVRK